MEIRSKIGSLDNAKHKAGGGNVKIFNEKKDLSNVGSKCGSMSNVTHRPGGGAVRITDEKLNFRDVASSKVGSMDNARHKAGGGDVKVDTIKVDFREKASSKVGSLDNARHIPGGGDKKIFSEVLPWTEPPKPVQPYTDYRQIKSHPINLNDVQPRVGSLDNANYQAGGGEVEIFNENLPWLKHNKPKLSQAEKDRIDKKVSLQDEAAFDRERQKRYDYKVKGRQYPSSRASTTESHGFGGDENYYHDGQKPKKQRYSTEDVRTSVSIINSNNSALSPVNESEALDNNNNKRGANEIAFSSIDEAEDAKEQQSGSRHANENLRRKASRDNNGAANATSSRRQGASDKYVKHAQSESRRQPGDDSVVARGSNVKKNSPADTRGDRIREAPRHFHTEKSQEEGEAMPTASTARIEPPGGLETNSARRRPSYRSNKASRRGTNDSKRSPRRVDPTIGARRTSDEQAHVFFEDRDPPPPPPPPQQEADDPWELVNETWEDQAHRKDTDGTSNKENRRPGAKKETGRGVKDLYRTEGYAERFKLMPVRPEDEAPQPVRLSPLLVEPKRDVSPEWKRRAQLKIDYDKDGREMTIKTNLKPSTRLPRVAGMGEEDAGGKNETYTDQLARSFRSPKRERRPHKISTDRLESILPSINKLLDVKDPPDKVYSLYSNQSRKVEIPRRRIHHPEPPDTSALQSIHDEYYDEFLLEAAKQFEPKPRKDPLNNADPHLNILQQNIRDYNREIDENRFEDYSRRHHEEIDAFDDYFSKTAADGDLYVPEVTENAKVDNSELYDVGAYPSPHKFDRLMVDAPPLDMSRASAVEFNDQLPPLPVNFNTGSATTATSSVSLQDAPQKGLKKRPDYLKWRPGEVPFDKRSSSKPSYSSGLSPPQSNKYNKKRSDEGFANRFYMQKGWYDDYNQRMRNRKVAEKIDARSLEQSTFELY